MPNRIVILAIVTAWLATMGWFAYREWRPLLHNDDAPAFVIELADEATPQVTHWTLLRNDKSIGSAFTRMTHQRDDTFELFSALKNLELSMDVKGFHVPIRVPSLVTIQRVTRAGELRSVESNITMTIATFEIKGKIEGYVREGKLHSKCSLDAVLLKVPSRELPPIELKSGSMWNPLQPHSKIKVRPGQRWRMTAVDPLNEALSTSLRQMGTQLLGERGGEVVIGKTPETSAPQFLDAEVLREPHELHLAGRSYSCYVIEYRDSEDLTKKLMAKTWINVADYRVLRQEAYFLHERLILQRDE